MLLQAFFKMESFPSFLPEAQVDFSPYIHCENLVELLEVKFMKVRCPSSEWVPVWFLSLRGAHAKPPAVHQLQF